MDRVRRTRVVREEEPEPGTRRRRIRSSKVDEDETQDEVEEQEGEDTALDDSPDAAQEGETEKEAGDRIEAKYRARATSPLKAIRAYCVLCMGCYPREVAKCTAPKCVLFPFRFGRNPFQKRG